MQNKNRWLLTIAIVLFNLGSNAQAQDNPATDIVLGYARCGSLGDSLDAPTGAGRLAWAKKNYSSNIVWKIYFNSSIVDPRNGQVIHYYPTFGVFTGAVGPDNHAVISNPRNYFGGVTEDAPANLPEDYTLTAMCAPGCFAPDTQIGTAPGQSETVSTLPESGLNQVMVPSESADFGNLNSPDAYESAKVDHYVYDLFVKNPAKQAMVSISFQSGNKLELTPEHAVLTPAGDMKKAKDVEAGDLFVKADGSFDEVQSAVTTQKAVRTYNLSMKNRSPKQNLVISNGYLTGSYLFQEKEVETLNRQVFRSAIPDSIANAI